MTYFIVAVVFWIVCGILAYGLFLAYNQKEWPSIAEKGYEKDRMDAIGGALAGPFGLWAALAVYGTKHGLMFCKKRELTMDDFLIPQKRSKR